MTSIEIVTLPQADLVIFKRYFGLVEEKYINTVHPKWYSSAVNVGKTPYCDYENLINTKTGKVLPGLAQRSFLFDPWGPKAELEEWLKEDLQRRKSLKLLSKVEELLNGPKN